MSSHVEGTREQAILAMVARVAGETSAGYLGRSAMQKIVYFLQVCGVPVRYRFNVHHYGPFAASILSDLESMVLDDIIVDASPNPDRYSKYEVGENADRLIAQFQEELAPHEDTIRSVVESLLPLRPERLELISTMDYAYRELRASRRGSPSKEDVIARFKQFKGDKFEQRMLDETFDRMKQAGILE